MGGDLGSNGYFSHIDSLGRDPGQRARDYGYTGGVGENIAAGGALSSAQAVFDLWKSSAGHNANMLGSTYAVIGIGRVNVPGSPYDLYWTIDFGEAPNAIGEAAPVTTCGSAPAPTSQTSVVGDVDCDSRVGATDALGVLRLVGGLGGRPVCNGAADVDCDGQVTAVDALGILAYVAGTPHRQKRSCPSIGSSG